MASSQYLARHIRALMMLAVYWARKHNLLEKDENGIEKIG